VGAPFDGGGTLGPVTSTPTLEYSTGRVYFTSRRYLGTGPSVWCVEIEPTGVINTTPCWPPRDLGEIDTSPVLRNGRLYVANTNEEVYSLDASDGTDYGGPPFDTNDGPVKGFLFPDRRSDNLYFATDSRVWSVTDAAGAGVLTTNWVWTDNTNLEPNIVLYWPGTSLVYVGSQDGKLFQLDFSGGAPSDPCTGLDSSCLWVDLGDGLDHIGAPSLDTMIGPPDVSVDKKMLHVGSESGVLYGVEVPLTLP
jgi:outer membrane protein assembly factor BamB